MEGRWTIEIVCFQKGGDELKRKIEFHIESRPRPTKIRRSYADNRHRRIGNPDLLADDLRIRAEMFVPETIAQHDRPAISRASTNVVGGRDQPAEVGLHPQNLEPVAAHHAGVVVAK